MTFIPISDVCIRNSLQILEKSYINYLVIHSGYSIHQINRLIERFIKRTIMRFLFTTFTISFNLIFSCINRTLNVQHLWKYHLQMDMFSLNCKYM